jgi:hypothetical protein
LALMVVFAAMFSVEVASAQVDPFAARPLGRIDCTARGVPTNVRAEGLAELLGDFELNCTNNGNPDLNSNYVQYVDTNIDIELLNSNFTGSDNVGASGFSEAVMIINENNAWNPSTASDVFDLGDACGAADERFPCPQKGLFVSGDTRIVFNDVQFPVPFAPNVVASAPLSCSDFADNSATGCFPPETTVRITNLRGNATVFGLGDSLPDITARLTITGPAQIFVDDNIKTVATPRIGLFSDIDGVAEGLQCIGFVNEEAVVTLEEGFAASFKTLGAPSFHQGSGNIQENGYPLLQTNSPTGSPQNNARTGGGASQATRFRIELSNIPEGVSVTAPREVFVGVGDCETPSGEDLCLRLVTGTNADGGGGTVSTSTGSYSVPLSNGAGLIVYEVIDADPFALEDISIVLDIDAPFDEDEPDLPAVGAGQARVTFGPLCEGDADCADVTNDYEVPRFIDSGGDPETIVVIVRCTTTLLWPFVTNQFGFDTGIVVSNTSLDWIGTPPQRGACTFHYIGRTGIDGPMPDEDVSSELEGGDQVAFTLSSGNSNYLINGAPDFQGFIVAQCEFQYAHGYAFIQDGFTGIPTLAQGYLALVIPLGDDGDRHPGDWHCNWDDGGDCSNDGLGERLSH